MCTVLDYGKRKRKKFESDPGHVLRRLSEQESKFIYIVLQVLGNTYIVTFYIHHFVWHLAKGKSNFNSNSTVPLFVVTACTPRVLVICLVKSLYNCLLHIKQVLYSVLLRKKIGKFLNIAMLGNFIKLYTLCIIAFIMVFKYRFFYTIICLLLLQPPFSFTSSGIIQKVHVCVGLIASNVCFWSVVPLICKLLFCFVCMYTRVCYLFINVTGTRFHIFSCIFRKCTTIIQYVKHSSGNRKIRT